MVEEKSETQEQQELTIEMLAENVQSVLDYHEQRLKRLEHLISNHDHKDGSVTTKVE